MAAPVIEFRDGSDVLVTAKHDFGQVTPGSPTASIVRNLWNGFGLTGGAAVDTVQNLAIVIEARLTATGGQWVSEGIGLHESLAAEVQLPNVPRYAGWTPVGKGITIRPGDLATDSKHEMNIRVNLPAGAQEVSVQFKFGVDTRRTIPLPGDALAWRPGISRGVGTGQGVFVLERSGAFTVSGTGASSAVRWPTYAWYLLGRPYQELGGLLSGDETLPNTDGAASALSAGEAYAFLTTLQATGRTIVKGLKLSGVPVFADTPAVPADSVLTGWGIRYADADALAPEHTELPGASAKCFAVTTSGLNYTVKSAGLAAVVANRLNDNVTDNTGTFPGDGTHTVWLLPDGSVDDTVGPDGAIPQAGSMRLTDIPIISSVEVAGRVDYRRWRDKAREIYHHLEAPVDADFVTWRNPGPERLWLRPESISIQHPGFTETDGELRVESYLQADGVAEVTIYTNKATHDERPWIGFRDAGDAMQIDDPAGSPVYTDETADFNSAAAADVNPFPASEATGDQFAIGYEAKFDRITLNVSTAATTGNVVLKYWDGSAWVALSNVVDDTADLTVTGWNEISWDFPVGDDAWQPQSIDSGPELYFVALELAGTFTGSDPVLTQGRISRVSETQKGKPEVLGIDPGVTLVHRVTVTAGGPTPAHLTISAVADVE